MKVILPLGIFTTVFVYVFTSFYNHTWNPMTFSNESIYTFASISALGWVAGLLWVALNPTDESQNKRKIW